MINNNYEAFEALKEYMVSNYNARLSSGGKEILKKCHFCGDSRDPSSAHMYIGMKDNLIVYNCFKCPAKGIVDGKFLRDMGCYDPNIMILCQEQNQKVIDSNPARFGTLNSHKFVRTPIIPLSMDEFSIKKMNYVSNRFNIEFNAQDICKFKIILSIKDFLNMNNITKFTRHPDMVDLINKFFIGFLSMDNRYIVFRRLIPEGKLPKYIDYRYLNYDIYGYVNPGMKYYTIPNYIDINKELDIHIAEGVFDIMSIYLNIAPIGSNGIFSAICGKSYLSLVRFFITNYGFGGFNLHLYPDADIDNYQMEKIKEDIRPFNIKVFIHRNTFIGEKDYGVSRDRIIDICTRI